MNNLGDREHLVLQTIITEYIQSSEPVGSRNVSKISPLNVSPATIRNIMGDLEEMGYIAQPHTSAGRIPTDLGYRYYIDHLVAADFIDPSREVKESLHFTSNNLPVLMQEFSRRLGSITGAVGFVATTKLDTDTVKLVELTRINKNTTIAVLVTKSGFTQNVLLPMDSSISDNELVHISNYLNEKLATISMSELGKQVRSEMEELRGVVEYLVEAERELLSHELYMEGTSNILNFPEFHDAHTLKRLLRTFEEKQILFDVLEKCTHSKGVQIFVGSEIGIEQIEELGLVTSSYELSAGVVGMIGVIGPKRMAYQKMIPVVNYSAQAINRILNQIYGGQVDDE
ncbi:MAG: heat-inducible transcriptional repressor HrcA [Deferribacteraceae bacterium]|jgi:heat-inducible transcriptional repressor|nr:heat-inducible transcriptional repressor HrcA [Deferribacteraceae bacterium]